MSIEFIALIAAGSLIGVIMLSLLYRHLPKRLRHDVFIPKWRQLQSSCRDKVKWPEALINADKLLDSALKRRKFKGKTMGERLVSAQKVFINNDEVWLAHNLTKKVVANPTSNLRETDVKAALIAFRQALRDLGALPASTSPAAENVDAGDQKS